ncbi:MAG TPA: UvrD-helicase domain-containing protein [Solirubrobacterales bacterium]
MAAGEQLALVPSEAATLATAVAPERTQAQRAAIEARERDVFTEAGAGAGKTGVLVDRYCDCVTEDGVAPDRILAFTFTERAAGELRERVHRVLAARARKAADDGELERAADIARAAREGERAWITTIHGFCRRLCAMHPVGAGVDPRFRVLDEVEAARIAERAFDAALEQTVASGGSPAARFAAAFHIRRLRGMVHAAHERLRSQGVSPVRLPAPGPPVRSVKDGDEAPELTPAELELAEQGLETFGALLAAFDREYERRKAERSAVDFEDLELRALDLLRRAGTGRDAWPARFAHVMVDEFQDTNRVQLALIDALRGPETRLFCVGDEFQSIYRFRHADLEVFRERRRAARADPAVDEIPLRGNFRSSPDVLAAVDFVGAALFGDEFPLLEAGIEPTGAPPGEGPAVELLITSGDERRRQGEGWRADGIDLQPPPGESNPAYVAEARFLAQRLRKLADEGIPRGDMVVLLRAFTHVDAFEEALERAGLSPYVVGGRGYWSQQQVEDALRLLGVIANPLDDELLFGALASPACGVSPDALWLLRQAARDPEGRPRHVWPTLAEGDWPDAMSAADARRLREFRARLDQLRSEAPLHPLDALIDRAISAFDYDLAILSLPNGERRMANLRKLMRLASEYEEHDGRDLRGFIDFARERTRRDEREGMAAVQVEGHDGVRVMTVHAAKGLEFPVVAVADLGRGPTAGSRAPDIALGRLRGGVGDPDGARFGMRLPVAGGKSLRLWELVSLCEEDEREEAAESLRLTYVAATRAQRRLILSGAPRHPRPDSVAEAPASATVVDLLLAGLAERGWSPEDGEAELPPPPAVGGGSVPGPAPRLAVRMQHPSAERAAELRRRWPARLPADEYPGEPRPPLLSEPVRAASAGHLSYSALADYAGCGYRFYVERVLGLASPLVPAHQEGDAPDGDPDAEADELIDPELGSRERSLAIGNCVHAALERSVRSSWALPAGDELEAILAREGIARDAEARARVQALLEGWLHSELRAELEAGGARPRPEVPFVVELAGTIVRGKIDLLCETPQGMLVVDYKTDTLRGSDEAELGERYATQRDLYAVAVDTAAPTGRRDAPIRAAYCFLEAPDRTVVERYDDVGLQAARGRLERLIGRIGAGEFQRTEAPHRSLCFGCPAAARLCGDPAWRPQWASSSP